MFQPCYFCDDLGWYPGTCLEYYGFYVCFHCRNFSELHVDYSIQEQGECGICFENTTLLTLPCNHKLCLQCCKMNYFGIATTERPVHWRELNSPIWPKEFDDPESVHYEEYEAFRTEWFNMDNSYEKLIRIRNNLLSIRPDWMNTETFLKYEDESLKYDKESGRLEKEWDEYEENKRIGCQECPFCYEPKKKDYRCWGCFLEK